MSEYIKLDGELLRKVQLTELEILKTVSRFCEENGIRYCLTSGTLLGAVRHGGFIPWDDDIDIAMPRKDFEEFLSMVNKLPEDYVCQATRFDSGYPLPIVKVRKRGTTMKEPDMAHLKIEHGIWIDIFPLEKVKHVHFLKVRARLVHLLTTAISFRLGTMQPKKIKTRILSAFLILFGIPRLDKLRTRIMTLEENTNGTLLTNFPSNIGYNNLLFDESVFFPLKKIRFEDGYYFSPAKSEVWLAQAYGDYMTPPPKECRINRHRVIEIKV